MGKTYFVRTCKEVQLEKCSETQQNTHNIHGHLNAIHKHTVDKQSLKVFGRLALFQGP